MIDPEYAEKVFSKHLQESDSTSFRQGLKKHCQLDLFGGIVSSEGESRVDLSRPSVVDMRIPLSAYLASALTGLSKEERSLVFHVSDVVSDLCAGQCIELYEPRKATDPVHHKSVADSDVFRLDRDRVLNSDLLVYLGFYASTGAGQELDFAHNALVPIIIISREGDKVSRMVTGIPTLKYHIKYTDPTTLRSEFNSCIRNIRPLLEERKQAFSGYRINVVGQRIRQLREDLLLTRKDIADVIPAMTEGCLASIEDSDDISTNPSLIQLRQLAYVLKVTVSELVDPSVNRQMLTYLENYLAGNRAARGAGSNEHDVKRILRRSLLRVIDYLEKE